MLAQQLANGIALGSVYALFALGFTLVFGVLEVINLSQGAIAMFGAFFALVAVTKLGLGIYPAMALAVGGAAVLGVLVDRLALAPLRARKAPHLAPMIATIGLTIFLTSLAQGLFGAQVSRFPIGLVPIRIFEVGPFQMTQLQVLIIGIAAALMVALLVLLDRTRLGTAIRAVAESPRAAALLGVDVERIYLITAAVTGGLGGAAGVLIGLSFNAISPFMGEPILLKGITVVILGGMGDPKGAMVGGVLLGLVEVLSVAYLSSDLRDAIAFGLLFLILVARPQGLFGRRLARKA
jgi:branched-chain amino acid transport system permease protein